MALLDLIIAKVKDDSGRLTVADDYQPALAAALETYGSHRPLELVRDLTGSGGHDLSLPEEWLPEVSRPLRVEYPIELVPASILAGASWTIYQGPAGEVLRLLDHTPSAEESVRLAFTVPRTEATVKAGDLDAVASLAASGCCEVLANLFTQTSDPTIAADVVNYRTKSGEFTRRAGRLADIYHQRLGVDPKGTAPAAMVTAEAPASRRGRLTH